MLNAAIKLIFKSYTISSDIKTSLFHKTPDMLGGKEIDQLAYFVVLIGYFASWWVTQYKRMIMNTYQIV